MEPVNVTYPIIQIDQHGYASIKCPSLSGGDWLDTLDYSTFCNDHKTDVKHHVNVITDWYGLNSINIFRTLLILRDALKYSFDIYFGPLNAPYQAIYYNSFIRPLKKIHSLTLVSPHLNTDKSA